MRRVQKNRNAREILSGIDIILPSSLFVYHFATHIFNALILVLEEACLGSLRVVIPVMMLRGFGDLATQRVEVGEVAIVLSARGSVRVHSDLCSLKTIMTLALVTLYRLYLSISTTLAQNALRLKLGCKAPASYPHKDLFFGLDAIRTAIQAGRARTFLDWIRSQYAKNWNTFTQRVFTSCVINTIEPENIKTVVATNYHHYRIGGRKKAFAPLFGDSIILSDGEKWKHSRALFQPSFTRSQLANIPMFETHVNNLIKAIPRDASVVDLGELFPRLTTDVATDFLLENRFIHW